MLKESLNNVLGISDSSGLFAAGWVAGGKQVFLILDIWKCCMFSLIQFLISSLGIFGERWMLRRKLLKVSCGV